MIRVCHITSVHNAQDTRIFEKECSTLAKNGYKVYLVAPGESYVKNDVIIVGLGDSPKSRINRMTSFSKRAYKKALDLNCQVYHFHDPELLPYGLRLKRKGHVVIFDSHEHTAQAILEKTYIPRFIRQIGHNIFANIQAHVCKEVDAVVTVTPHLVDYFKKINPNTVLVANYPIYRKDATKPNYNSRKICFAGQISKQWHHETVIKAISKIDNVRYCLCGPADESYLDSLKQLEGWEKVDYYGKIPFDEVPVKLSESAVGIALLQPGNNTDWERGTMGNTKIFEEMMAGLPVICTDFTLWKEFIEKYNCGFCVKPDDESTIAEKIRFLIENPYEAAKMGGEARSVVEKNFTWEVESAKLLELYSSLL